MLQFHVVGRCFSDRLLKDPYPDIARADDALDEAGAALYNALME
jgi:hypothetical protein